MTSKIASAGMGTRRLRASNSCGGPQSLTRPWIGVRSASSHAGSGLTRLTVLPLCSPASSRERARPSSIGSARAPRVVTNWRWLSARWASQTPRPVLLRWLVEQALPEYVPGAMRRSRRHLATDYALMTRRERAAHAALADLEADYAARRADLTRELENAQQAASALRDGLLYG